MKDFEEALKWYQACKYIHPLTCGNKSSHALLVYKDGELVCLDCDYRQDPMTVASHVMHTYEHRDSFERLPEILKGYSK